MSKYMLNDEDAINDINPFVMHDFSLPGGVRQSGNFDDYKEIAEDTEIPEAEKSVYCDYGLCKDESVSCSLSGPLQPQRNIDPGFTGLLKSISLIEDEDEEEDVQENLDTYLIRTFILTVIIAMLLYYARR